MNQVRLTVVVLCLLSVPHAFAEAAESKNFTTSDGVKIHYIETGSGEPIVFIPGWTMPAWIWQKQIDDFSKRYRVIAVDPRSQGESDKPSFGHLPETRARDYKELVDHAGLKRPVLVGWSMACTELMKYVEQFGTDNVKALVFVDGYLPDKPNLEMLTGLSGWMNQLQQDRRKQADGFVRSMFKKPQPDAYINRLTDASIQVPADTAVVLIYNILGVKDLSGAFAKMDRRVLFVYQPNTQQTADMLKARLGDKVQLERFDGDGHALFVEEPEKFDSVLEQFIQHLNQ